MQNLTGHLQGGSSEICFTMSSSRLSELLFFSPLVLLLLLLGRRVLGVSALMGDGGLGEIRSGCVAEAEEEEDEEDEERELRSCS